MNLQISLTSLLGFVCLRRDILLSCFALKVFADFLIAGGRVSGEFVQFCSFLIWPYKAGGGWRAVDVEKKNGPFLTLADYTTLGSSFAKLELSNVNNPEPEINYHASSSALAIHLGVECAKATWKVGNPAVSTLFAPFTHAIDQIRDSPSSLR